MASAPRRARANGGWRIAVTRARRCRRGSRAGSRRSAAVGHRARHAVHRGAAVRRRLALRQRAAHSRRSARNSVATLRRARASPCSAAPAACCCRSSFHPRASIASPSWYTSTESEVKANTTRGGAPSTRRPGIARDAGDQARRRCRAASSRAAPGSPPRPGSAAPPRPPRWRRPARVPVIVGERVQPARPPGVGVELVPPQRGVAVQHHRRALRRVAVLVQVRRERRHARHLEVEGAAPSRPSFFANGRKKPPRHASTWHSRPRADASAASSAMGSTTPCGYDGALSRPAARCSG